MPMRDLMPPEEQARILSDHARAPRKKGLLPEVRHMGTRDLDGFSVLKMQVLMKDQTFEDVRWDGSGTKVFVASASILSSWLAGKTIEDYNKLLELWEKMLAQVEVVEQAAFLGDVRALEYVIRNRPDRVREIQLAWTAVAQLIEGRAGVRPPTAAAA
jgi:NifU-like protein involved in Fe-S cluster formation